MPYKNKNSPIAKASVTRATDKYRQCHREDLVARHKIKKESSFRNFLFAQLIDLKRKDRVIQRECNLDIEYIMDLLIQQGGCCIYCDIKMTHKVGNLRAISIDRIDSTKGHVRGNVQLTCQFDNLGKRDKLDFEVRELYRERKNKIEMDLLKKLKEQGYLRFRED